MKRLRVPGCTLDGPLLLGWLVELPHETRMVGKPAASTPKPATSRNWRRVNRALVLISSSPLFSPSRVAVGAWPRPGQRYHGDCHHRCFSFRPGRLAAKAWHGSPAWMGALAHGVGGSRRGRIADHVDGNRGRTLRRATEVVDHVIDDTDAAEGDGQQVVELDAGAVGDLDGVRRVDGRVHLEEAVAAKAPSFEALDGISQLDGGPAVNPV